MVLYTREQLIEKLENFKGLPQELNLPRCLRLAHQREGTWH